MHEGEHEYIIENVRLRELVAVATLNRDYFNEFAEHLSREGYLSIYDFVNEPNPERGSEVIGSLLSARFRSALFDGIGRPYTTQVANWYFIAWLFRDAPAQRLQPMISSLPGRTTLEKRTFALNTIRISLQTVLTDPTSWTWPAFFEVMVARLEGSRRSLKGSLVEAMVRRLIQELAVALSLNLRVDPTEVRLLDETYDVVLSGASGQALIPVKSRETMGGGHAMLFTRDIHKSITVALANGYTCMPIVVDESWAGKLDSLGTEYIIVVRRNPNQILDVEADLRVQLVQKLVQLNGLLNKT